MATCVIISSPSGGGKNTVIRELLKRFPRSIRVITTTTREPREGEVHGVDYYFTSLTAFETMERQSGFVETNRFAGNAYGTEVQEFQRCMSQYEWVFSQVDVHGKHAFDQKHIPHRAIFLLPESLESLRVRVRGRGGMPEDALAERMKIAEDEIREARHYDLSLVNEDGKLSETVSRIEEFLLHT